jgi:hypothetical protein
MQPDWFDIISLVVNLVLAALAIGLSVFFFWETAKVERRVIEMLGKIEMMSTSMQQVQSELVRTAWQRYVAGAAFPIAGEELEEAVEEPQHREEASRAQETEAQAHAGGLVRFLRPLDAGALATLRMLVVNSPTPNSIALERVVDPVVNRYHWLDVGGEAYDSIPLHEFLEGLRSLNEHEIAEDVRKDSTGEHILVKLSDEFMEYWHYFGSDLHRVLLSILEAEDLAEQFSQASPMS